VPVPRWLSAGLGVPSPCACRLLRPRPRSAPRRRDPRCSPPSEQTFARGQRLPTPMRTRGARGLRSDRPPAAPADLVRLPKAPPCSWVGEKIRTAGGRSHLARACGSRAGVSRWGIAGVASYEQRGAPTRDVPARSHAKVGRRAGLEPRPERRLRARGAKEEGSHAVSNKEVSLGSRALPSRCRAAW
jgi:hypothetical protein